METIIPKLQEWVTFCGLKIIAALVIIIVGRWLAKAVKRVVVRLMGRADVNMTVVTFVSNLAYFAVLAFVIVAALSQLGIQTTSFIAVLGAAGLAVGLALQGSLSNFAAGMLMIVFRPFEVGQFIESSGVSGTVEEIHIFTTHLTTPDNKAVIIPNAKLTGNSIVNYSAKQTRRVDLQVSVSYEDDLKKVRRVLEQIVSADERILKEPAPLIAVSELADSSVNLVMRLWVNASNFEGVKFGTTEKVKLRFDEEGITIPYPQRDVNLHDNRGT